MIFFLHACENEQPAPEIIQGDITNDFAGLWRSETPFPIGSTMATVTNLSLSASNFSFSFEERVDNIKTMVAAMSGNLTASESNFIMEVSVLSIAKSKGGTLETVKKGEEDWEILLDLAGIDETEIVPYSINENELSITLNNTRLYFVNIR
ncbi:MAG TPA: hypothetical protein DDX98_14050 [Bacteroidales bacterium]|nr:hypothetical protein [Bacteroidales bacterium]